MSGSSSTPANEKSNNSSGGGNSSPKKKDSSTAEDKVKVHFVAVGSAPIMKKTKFQISANQRFSAVHAFLRKVLKLDQQHHQQQPGGGGGSNAGSSSSSLFLYCCGAFVPGPEELVGDLRDCFSVRDELVIHYSLQEAWG